MKSIENLTLHVGLPKTGSSLIQRSLRRSRVGLRARGVAYIDRRDFLEMEDYRAWAAYDRPEYSKDAFFTQLEKSVSKEQRKTRHGGRDVLISNESIPGRLQPDYPNPFWPRAGESVQELLEVTEPERTHIVVYVRRQDRLLESLYMQRIHTGHTTTWEEFKEKTIGDHRVDFNILIDTLTAVAGVESITVRPFELIGAGGTVFVADFFDAAGLGPMSPPRDTGTSNPSYTEPAWEAALVLNKHIEGPHEARAVREFLSGMFPPGEYPKASLLSDEERLDLIDSYSPLNRAMFERHMPGLPPDSYSASEGTEALGAVLSPPLTAKPEPVPIPASSTVGAAASVAVAAHPTLEQIRAISQPIEILDRRSEEHWTGRYMRRISPHITLQAVRRGIRPNLITAFMVLVGLLGVGVAAVPGVWSAVGVLLLIQGYLLLDCVDGETARYTKQTSAKGVYLDRLGHYLVEAGLMVALGIRVASGDLIWVVAGLVAALLVMLEKVETDLVSVARLRSGLGRPAATADIPRSAGVAGLRRTAQKVPIHLMTHAAEASILILLAAIADWLFADTAVISRALLLVMIVVSGLMVVVHLFSIWQSRRLEP